MRKTAKERLAERDARARSELLDALFEPWIGAANNPDLLARLGGLDVPVPFSPPLEDAYRPNAEKIYRIAGELARF